MKRIIYSIYVDIPADEHYGTTSKSKHDTTEKAEITVDLAGTDIGMSIKISSVKLPENVIPTITDRDFVVATVAAPTVIKEPEKPAEETPAEGAEGEAAPEGAEAASKEGDGAKKDDKAKEGADKKSDDKKPAEKKPAEKK